jgi:pimeloyl-ACP methyl ester carboxylesterase
MEDEYSSPQHAQQIAAAIRGAELWLVPGVGHMLPQQIAREFNRRLIEFLH